jgi:hypothetical protein
VRIARLGAADRPAGARRKQQQLEERARGTRPSIGVASTGTSAQRATRMPAKRMQGKTRRSSANVGMASGLREE